MPPRLDPYAPSSRFAGERNVLPSVKMSSMDVPELACVRGLHKEFDLFTHQLSPQPRRRLPDGGAHTDDSQISVDKHSLVVWDETVNSPSYPSLATRYTMHQLTAFVKGLPSNNFVTYEQDGDATKEHFWEWREVGSNDLDIRVLKFKRPSSEGQARQSPPNLGSTEAAATGSSLLSKSLGGLSSAGDEPGSPLPPMRGLSILMNKSRFSTGSPLGSALPSSAGSLSSSVRRRRGSLWSYLQGSIGGAAAEKGEDASKFSDTVIDEYMANVPYFRWSREMVDRVATRLKKLHIFREVGRAPSSCLAGVTLL